MRMVCWSSGLLPDHPARGVMLKRLLCAARGVAATSSRTAERRIRMAVRGDEVGGVTQRTLDQRPASEFPDASGHARASSAAAFRPRYARAPAGPPASAPRARRREHALLRLGDQVIHHVVEVAR